MRTSDVDILMVPGWNGSGPDHWQSRWERNLKTARRVEQDDWERPDKDQWVGNIIRAVAATSRPAVLVAHSLGAHRGCACRREAPARRRCRRLSRRACPISTTPETFPAELGQSWPEHGFGFRPSAAATAQLSVAAARLHRRSVLPRGAGARTCGRVGLGPDRDRTGGARQRRLRARPVARRRAALREVSEAARLTFRATWLRPRCR